MTDHVHTLENGRRIGYTLFGPPDGYPVLYFHGTPSSRLEPMLLAPYGKSIDELLTINRLRLISVDRPGMGNSDFYNCTFLSFAKDLAELLLSLNIQQAASLGWSGAGPYILSMAFHFPALINSVHIVAGFTRSFSEKEVFRNMTANRYYFGAANFMPGILRLVLKVHTRKPAKQPLPQWLSQWPDADHRLMKDHEERMLAFSCTTIMEAVKQSSRGVVHEARLYFEKPGYDLREITQPLHYWWGTEDNVVQWVHAEAIRKYVPGHYIHVKQNEGHFSIYINHIEEILANIRNNLPGDV